MRKSLLTILLIFLLSFPVMAQYINNSSTAFIFNAGNFGFGANLPINEKNDFEISLSLANFGIESRAIGLGFEISPIVTYFSDFGDNNSNSNNDSSSNSFGEISVLNIGVYFNVVNLFSWWGGHFFLGPFVSANYIFLNENVSWDKYIFTTGVKMGIRTTRGNFHYPIFSFEFGYRNINGTHNYHIGGKLDLITLFLAYVLVN